METKIMNKHIFETCLSYCVEPLENDNVNVNDNVDDINNKYLSHPSFLNKYSSLIDITRQKGMADEEIETMISYIEKNKIQITFKEAFVSSWVAKHKEHKSSSFDVDANINKFIKGLEDKSND